MASFTFLHAADIHLDSPLTGLSSYEGVPAAQVRAAPRAAFDRLIHTAIERRVDFLVIAGDLYDRAWRDMGTGLYFAAAMGRLARAGIPVYLLAGNHDAASVITREMPRMDHVHTFSARKPDTHRIAHLDVAIHGRSFAERAASENLAATYPAAMPGAFNIGMLHTSLAGHAEHETYAPCTPPELAARGYDYWALGHVHEHAVISTNPHIVFPGNLQGRHIREEGPRGAVLVHVTDGEVARLERLELDAVRWARLTVEVSGAADMDGLHDAARKAVRALPDHDRPMILRVTVSGRTRLHQALQDPTVRLRDDLRGIAAESGRELWIERIVVSTQPPHEATGATEPGEFGALIPAPDAALTRDMRAEFKKFADSLPPDTLPPMAEEEWAALARTAGQALAHRLGAG